MSEPLSSDMECQEPPEGVVESPQKLEEKPTDVHKTEEKNLSDTLDDIDWNFVDSEDDKESVVLNKQALEESSHKTDDVLDELLNEGVRELEEAKVHEVSEEPVDEEVTQNGGEIDQETPLKGNEDIDKEDTVKDVDLEVSQNSEMDLGTAEDEELEKKWKELFAEDEKNEKTTLEKTEDTILKSVKLEDDVKPDPDTEKEIVEAFAIEGSSENFPEEMKAEPDDEKITEENQKPENTVCEVVKDTPEEKAESEEIDKPEVAPEIPSQVIENPEKEPDKRPSVTEDNSSMSMDLIESSDMPSDRGDAVEDDSTPMDMEVDETANAEWPVNNFGQKDNTEEKPQKPKHYECINVACKSQNGVEYAVALGFIVSFYSTKKRKKIQYVCQECHDVAISQMKKYCSVLKAHKPLFHHFPQHTDVVEISDSSDDSSPEDEIVQSMRKPLSEAEKTLVEQSLDEIIIATMEKVKINQQFEWTKKDLGDRVSKLDSSHAQLSAEFQKIQKVADGLFKSLNSREKRMTQHEPPIHIYTEFPAPDDDKHVVHYRMITEKGGATLTPSPAMQASAATQAMQQTLPIQPAAPVMPTGQMTMASIKPTGEVKVGTVYYGMRTQLTKPWNHCEVLNKLQQGGVDSETRYQVKFIRHQQEGILTGKQLAFAEAPTQKLPVGCRVLAMFSNMKRKLFYPGIVAEPMQETNNFRYLIFFDDGYVQYVYSKDVRRICRVSENVWDDVNPNSRDFIKNYLQENQYQRAVAQVKIGQKIEVERNGKWVSMRVAKVDASIILVYYDDYTEWIYSGSQRLLPIYRMKMDSRLSTGKKLQTRNEPYVSFRNVDDDTQRATEQRRLEEDSREVTKDQTRSVAKKSTQPPAPVNQPQKQLMNNSTIFLEDDNYPKGKVIFYTAKFNMPPKSYTPHNCNPDCLYRISYDLNLYNPLAKPLLSGWERKIYRVKARRYVVYKAPCGRSLRGIDEVHTYLRFTDCNLNVDNYDFDPAVHCLAEYVIDSAIVRKSDISNGVESMPIACVNCYDDTVPPTCIYANHRIPTEGVNLNLDPEFLCGCDCTDDCMDKSKCACWQLTIAGVRCLTPTVDPNTVGYTYKKLYDPVPTGIYECNSRCKCKMNCLNRVVQHPLSLKLQVFKTANRGWGLRCLNDVPKGQFICIYAGHLLTEQKANEGGQNHGDEYFAELDYIEVAEGIKEGYEPEAPEEDSASDRDDVEYNPKRRRGSDSDDDYFSVNTAVVQKTIKTRSKTRRSDTTGHKSMASGAARVQGGERNANEDVIAISDDEDERIPQSFEPNISIEKEDMPSKKARGLRRMFGKGEDVYVMDAKIMGNVGRYFNHSCSPNLFVQNVFVDTHDLRFPWVAFFAMCHIRAGTELTWNYNYDVGTVPGKFLFCQCGSKNCRGRIL
ncbi:histone-lysine N-methyltransferase eggless isoform X2 [Phlebotomus argentipes]|nr:histone-lysine N-methyltransferase eggless isoform X2 [Phlebotomus argentipes]